MPYSGVRFRRQGPIPNSRRSSELQKVGIADLIELTERLRLARYPRKQSYLSYASCTRVENMSATRHVVSELAEPRYKQYFARE